MYGFARQGALPLLACCIAIFHFGWLKFLGHGEAVYLADWAVRLAILAVAWPAVRSGMAPWYPAVRPRDWLIGLVSAYLMLGYSDLIVQILFFLLFDLQPVRFMAFPTLEIGTFWWFDLIFGLFLVGLSEELVYRKLFADLWREKGWRTWSLYLISALAFGLLHANQGPVRGPEAIAWGLFFMWLYRRTGSLPFVVALHWLVDAVYFSERFIPYVATDNRLLCAVLPKCVDPEALATWPAEYLSQVIILGSP